MLIVKLPEQSWFGDFQILLNLESTFQLEAGKPNEKAKLSQEGMVQIYKLKG